MSMEMIFEVISTEITQQKPVVVMSEFSVGPPASFDNLAAAVSNQPGNALRIDESGKMYVPDPVEPDPLLTYLLTRG